VRHRERVVCRDRASGRLVDGLEQREVDDPQEVEPALVDRRPAELQAEQAEQPAPPSTAVIIVPTGTATPTEPAPTATLAPTAVAEKSPLDEESAQGAAPAAEDRADESDRGNTWLVALGIILLAVSIALFVFGRTKARRA